jgi:ribosomal protein S18 acetylase RimI-like enzyme
MRFSVVPAQAHRLDEYRDTFEGYRAVQLRDDADTMVGELVWRLATGNTVEITEMGIFDESNRKRGLGSKLLAAGLESIQEFFSRKPYPLRRIYLFCDSINEPARTFYEKHGFRVESILGGFYHYCDAVLYVLDAERRIGGS